MIKPNEETVRALAAASGTPAFDVIQTWIQDSLVTQALSSTHKTGEVAIKAAGGCNELEELLKYWNNAQTYLKNARANS